MIVELNERQARPSVEDKRIWFDAPSGDWESLCALMKRCWAHDPHTRPSFDFIQLRLDTIRGQLAEAAAAAKSPSANGGGKRRGSITKTKGRRLSLTDYANSPKLQAQTKARRRSLETNESPKLQAQTKARRRSLETNESAAPGAPPSGQATRGHAATSGSTAAAGNRTRSSSTEDATTAAAPSAVTVTLLATTTAVAAQVTAQYRDANDIVTFGAFSIWILTIHGTILVARILGTLGGRTERMSLATGLVKLSRILVTKTIAARVVRTTKAASPYRCVQAKEEFICHYDALEVLDDKIRPDGGGWTPAASSPRATRERRLSRAYKEKKTLTKAHSLDAISAAERANAVQEGTRCWRARARSAALPWNRLSRRRTARHPATRRAFGRWRSKRPPPARKDL